MRRIIYKMTENTPYGECFSLRCAFLFFLFVVGGFSVFLFFFYSIIFRSLPIAPFSRRETCACEMPISAAISVCVLPL